MTKSLINRASSALSCTRLVGDSSIGVTLDGIRFLRWRSKVGVRANARFLAGGVAVWALVSIVLSDVSGCGRVNVGKLSQNWVIPKIDSEAT